MPVQEKRKRKRSMAVAAALDKLTKLGCVEISLREDDPSGRGRRTQKLPPRASPRAFLPWRRRIPRGSRYGWCQPQPDWYGRLISKARRADRQTSAQPGRAGVSV